MNVSEKQNTLTKYLLPHSDSLYPDPLFIACSGGLDSRFLAHFAKHIGIKNIHLLHITGAHIDPAETKYLKEWAQKHSYTLHLIPLNILQNQEIQNNHPLRCYHCKYTAFSAMLIYIQKNFSHSHEIKQEITIHDGTHFEDTKSHRPGLQALQELKIQSPLALSHFTKQDILQSAQKIALENPRQKSKPCLLTRFAYNTNINLAKLQFIAEAEKTVEEIFIKNFEENKSPQFRIREVKTNTYELHTMDKLANPLIETLQSALKKVSIKNKFRINSIEHTIVKTMSGYFDRLEH